MENLKKQYRKKYGYSPSDNEILNLYFQGNLNLTNKQENEIIKHFNL